MRIREGFMDETDQEKLDTEIAGEYNTLRVYIYMLKVRVASYREVQKALRFSSPTLAKHHLEKLEKYDLVKENYDGTFYVKSKSFGILKLYVRSGKWIVPRTIFFAIIFGILAFGFLVLLQQHQFFWVASILSLIGLAYALYETVRSYRVLPQT